MVKSTAPLTIVKPRAAAAKLGRLRCPPVYWTGRTPRAKSRLVELDEVARTLGYEDGLHEWQRVVLDVGTELDAKGLHARRIVGVMAHRQAGKSALLDARIMGQLLKPRQLVIATAQDRLNARRAWEDTCMRIIESPYGEMVEHWWRGSGTEVLRMTNGSVFRIFTPGPRGARGLSTDLAIIDEALAHGLDLMAAVQPTLIARPGSQLWVLSNAGDETSHLLNHLRALGHQAIEAGTRSMAWLEWSPPVEALDDLDPMDEELWRRVMPTLDQPGGIPIEVVRGLAESMPEDNFCREMLCLHVPRRGQALIPPDDWAACNRADVIVTGSQVIGVAMTQERDGGAMVASSRISGYLPVEVIEAREGVGWMLERVAAVALRWDAVVAIDAGSTAGTLIPHLEAMGVRVKPLAMREYARSCGAFYDAVRARRVAHLDDWRLNDAVANAGKRPLAQVWAWARRAPELSIAPLEAASIAAWVADTTEEAGELWMH